MAKVSQKMILDVNNNMTETDKILDDNCVYTQKHEEIIVQPFEYLKNFFNQNLSESLTQEFEQLSITPNQNNNEVSILINTLNEANMLVDDIEENVSLQHGVPGAHHIFGLPMAINTAHYIKAKAVDRMLKNIPKEKVGQAIKIGGEQMIKYHEAEGLIIYLRSQGVDENSNEMLKLKENKREALITLGVRLVKLLQVE